MKIEINIINNFYKHFFIFLRINYSLNILIILIKHGKRLLKNSLLYIL